MYCIVYKITNNINNKIYIGAHKTNFINDKYMGSGLAIKRSIKKNGVENFTKEILFVFDNQEEMLAKERELVNEDFVLRDDTYNIAIGGRGFTGYTPFTGQEFLGKTHTDASKEKIRIANIEQHANGIRDSSKFQGNEFLGKHHTEDTKRVIGAKNSISQKGTGNSQYGTCWIYSLEKCTNKKIDKCDLEEYLNNGWIRGRKMKFTSGC